MAPSSLQTKDHEELLNIIDDLRALGVSKYIDLPQLIVCGDQSSGKSSVLEAISGLKFPTKDNLCTRFATELILRRGPERKPRVTIIPDDTRSNEEQRRLEEFNPSNMLLEDFGNIVGDAEKAMGLDQMTKAFSQDVLRVEVSGPNQPHLTLVDLPGLFHSGNKTQSIKDSEAVQGLVLKYMRQARCIILPVVSAKNDYANQIITKFAQDIDPAGRRTLGIITKPDTLYAGSESEKAFLQLAENKDVRFRLGWHVVMNRDYNTRHSSSEERDATEAAFFMNPKGIWKSLSPGGVGIERLKHRLSAVLQDQILTELPGLIKDVETRVVECREQIARLGSSRDNFASQRQHLYEVANTFNSRMKDAVNGTYNDSFFGDAMTEQGYSKRLRAVAVNTLIEFNKTLDRSGQARKIVDQVKEEDVSKTESPEISREDYLEEVAEHMRRNRGVEVPGTFNPAIIGPLFYKQAAPWKTIVDSCTEQLLESATTTIHLVLNRATDSHTSDAILQYIINPALEPLRDALKVEAQNTLRPYQEGGHPITFSHHFTDNIQKAHHEEMRRQIGMRLSRFFGTDVTAKNSLVKKGNFNLNDLWNLLCQHDPMDQDRFACIKAIEAMQSYYQVAKDNLVDSFSVSSIEKCLLKELPRLFSGSTVFDLSEKQIENIAAETKESKAERKSLTEKQTSLERALTLLHRLDRHKPREQRSKRSSTQAGF